MAAGPGTEELFAYDMLSVLKANYTAILDTDASLAHCSTIFLGASMSQPALEQLLSEAENASITVFGGVSNEYLSSLFLRTAGPQQTNVDEVSTPTERLLLPSPLPIALAQPAPGVEVTSEYIGPSNVSIPLSLRTVVGGHEIDYINIVPFIETPRATYPCFPIIAEAAGIHVNQAISVPNPYGSFEVAFTSASLVGTTSFKTASVVINSTGPTIQVDITSEQGSGLVTEAASLSVYSDTGTMTISTSSANITGGAGFYAYASVGRSLTGEGSDLQARLDFLNGTSKVLGSIREFSVSEPVPEVHGLELTVRSPTVGVSGSAVFTKLEPLSFPTFSSLKRSAKATFAGNVSFDLPLSDYYSIVQGLRYSGGATYSGASLALTEASSLYGISPELVAAGLVLAWWYHFKRPSRGEASRHLAEQEDREA
jgi:hypothetical protein